MLNDRWCEFVLNEGIMPSSLVRLLKSDEANRHDAALLARILQERESFDNPKYPEISKNAKTAFLYDEEATKWLNGEIVKCVLNIIANADSNKDPELLTDSFSTFINICTLVKDEYKKKYLLPKNYDKNKKKYILPENYKKILEQGICQKIMKNKPWKYNMLAPSSKKEEEFTEFLRHRTKCKESTIKIYRSIINKLNRELDFYDIWDIEDAKEMEKLYKKLNSIPLFISMNINSHNVLFRSLKLYIEFLDNRAMKK